MEQLTMTSEDLTRWIKCDAKCPAQAKYLTESINGELFFCGHHLNKYKATVDSWAFEIIELDKVEETPKPKKQRTRRKEIKNG